MILLWLGALLGYIAGVVVARIARRAPKPPRPAHWAQPRARRRPRVPRIEDPAYLRRLESDMREFLNTDKEAL